jgi:CheY-like chemotaxis protein
MGTTFHLYLPVATEGAEPALAATSNPRRPSRGSGHILLAEDDPLVRQFAAERLLDHGFEVTVASNGAEALELLSGIETLALLFTDVIMVGGVSGRELADEVEARRPGTPVLYASGYTEDVMVHQGRLDPGVALLAKPYTGRQLIDRIHAVLGNDGRGEK